MRALCVMMLLCMAWPCVGQPAKDPGLDMLCDHIIEVALRTGDADVKEVASRAGVKQACVENEARRQASLSPENWAIYVGCVQKAEAYVEMGPCMDGAEMREVRGGPLNEPGIGDHGRGDEFGGPVREGGLGLGVVRPTGKDGDNDRAMRTPVLKHGRVQTARRYDQKIVKRMILQQRREIVSCYDKALRQDASLEGTVVIRWTVNAEGEVVSRSVTVVEQTMTGQGGDDVAACLVEGIRSWRFPKSKDGVALQATYPFVLTTR